MCESFINKTSPEIINYWKEVDTHNFVIHYDSTYAANMTEGKWTPRANKNLIEHAQTIMQAIKQKTKVTLYYIKSHTGEKDYKK